jgi:hypothetical protein
MQDTLQSSMGRQLENNWNLELTKKRNLTQVNNTMLWISCDLVGKKDEKQCF